jgi:cytochrome c oxidase assembly protein subunit 15
VPFHFNYYCGTVHREDVLLSLKDTTSSLHTATMFFFANRTLFSAGVRLSAPVLRQTVVQQGLRSASSISAPIASAAYSSSASARKLHSTVSRARYTLRKSASSIFNTVPAKFFSTAVPRLNSTAESAATGSSSGTTAGSRNAFPKSNWPANSHKAVGYLCIGTSILVFAIVVLGGLTRLTESGLSITEWKPVTGALPPMNEADWIAEFEKYKDSPEFKLLNSHMELDDFKFIYGMEWSHRLLGRVIGMVFVLPTLYFIARKQVSVKTAGKLLGICGLIGLQGAIGWWMVYSGIDTNLLEERRSMPTVSQYRLATHLGAAFVVYCAMISTGFSVLRNQWIMQNPAEYAKYFQQIQSKSLSKFRLFSKGIFGLIFLTAMSGAFVAGLDAGLIYNTFPHMGEDWIPSKAELFDPLYSRVKDQTDLWWRNMLENQATVQLEHRILATLSAISVFALHMHSHKIKSIVPRPAYKWLNISMGVVTLQYILGMCTLLYLVPVDLAAAHQAGALTLLTCMLLMVNNLKKPSRANMLILKKYIQQNAAKK